MMPLLCGYIYRKGDIENENWTINNAETLQANP
jgi:hypothetical protein